MLDRDIFYSILDKRPKRAKCYFFINVRVTDSPFTHTYTVNSFGTKNIFRVTFYLGFKVNQRVNRFLHQVMRDLMQTGEMAKQPIKYSIYRNPEPLGEMRYCIIRKVMTGDVRLGYLDRLVMNTKFAIRKACGSPVQWFNLLTSHVVFEFVPFFNRLRPVVKLEREQPSNHQVNASIFEDEDESDIVQDDDDVVSGFLDQEKNDVTRDTEDQIIGGKEWIERTGRFALSDIAKAVTKKARRRKKQDKT